MESKQFTLQDIHRRNTVFYRLPILAVVLDLLCGVCMQWYLCCSVTLSHGLARQAGRVESVP